MISTVAICWGFFSLIAVLVYWRIRSEHEDTRKYFKNGKLRKQFKEGPHYVPTNIHNIRGAKGKGKQRKGVRGRPKKSLPSK